MKSEKLKSIVKGVWTFGSFVVVPKKRCNNLNICGMIHGRDRLQYAPISALLRMTISNGVAER